MLSDLISDPFVGFMLRFMLGSTLILGGVWCAERVGILKDISVREAAWKAGLFATALLLLPVPRVGELHLPVLPSTASEARAGTGEPVPFLKPGSDSEVVQRRAHQGPAGQPQEGEQSLPAPAFSSSPVTVPLSPGLLERILGWSKILLVWGLYGVTGMALLMLSYRLAIRALGGRKRVSLESREGRLLTRLVERTGVRFVPYLSRSEAIKSPVCLMGREICLPSWAFDNFDDAKLESLLAHELAHLERKDPWMLLLLQLASRLFFFQPLIRIAKLRLMDIAELQADAWAARRLNSGRTVAEALFECAQNITTHKTLQWGFAMTGRPTILSERVSRLLNTNSTAESKGRKPAVFAVAAALVTVGATVPGIELAEAASVSDGLFEQGPFSESFENADLDADIDHDFAYEVKQDVAVPPLGRARPNPVPVPATPPVGQLVSPNGAVLAAPRALASASPSRAVDVRTSTHTNRGWSVSHSRNNDTGAISVANTRESVNLHWTGDLHLMADDRTLQFESRSGTYTIQHNSSDFGPLTRTVTKKNGRIVKDQFEKNGRVISDTENLEELRTEWQPRAIAMLVDHGGFQVHTRVERILEKNGVPGVLKEIKRLEQSWVKRKYIAVLAETGDLNSRQTAELIDIVAGFDGDHDKRLAFSQLIDIGDISDQAADKIIKAAAQFDSDHEIRLLASHLMDEKGVNKRQLERIAQLAQKMESDHEVRLLLSHALDEGAEGEAVRKAVLKAAKLIESDHEFRLLVSVLADHEALSAKEVAEIAAVSGRKVDSDHELRLLLSVLADEHGEDKTAVSALIKALDSIESDFETRLLIALYAEELTLTDKHKRELKRKAEGISSRFERSQALRSLGFGDDD